MRPADLRADTAVDRVGVELRVRAAGAGRGAAHAEATVGGVGHELVGGALTDAQLSAVVMVV